jgi:predicted nuclease of predicted toxin-antitoxin system
MDDVIMRWARDNDHVVLTADLDFGTLLVRSREARPSIVQLRMGDTLVRRVGDIVLAVLADTGADLAAGALVTIERGRYRIRRLSENL